jgi:hypothetical protein
VRARRLAAPPAAIHAAIPRKTAVSTADPTKTRTNPRTPSSSLCEDDETRGAEADRLRRDQRLEETEKPAEEDRGPPDRLREHHLRRTAIRSEGHGAEEERRQRNDEEHELDERHRATGEVLDAVPPRQNVTGPGDGEGEGVEDGREHLRPARAHGDEALVAREQEQGRKRSGHREPPGGPAAPKISVVATSIPPAASTSAAREASSNQAASPDPMGVERPGTRA